MYSDAGFVSSRTASDLLPSWLDRTEYPFTSRFINIEGHQMHYVDEGAGQVLLMVHGTPVWSFLYRHCIKRLSARYRCIALDHLGFGLSEKPTDADYSPQAHARRLKIFAETLGLYDITVVTQDYGGPIALDYASRVPGDIVKIILANTWIHSLRQMEQGSRLFDNFFGKWLYLKYGFSAKFMIPHAFADKRALLPEVHAHYLAPLDTPHNRKATFALVQASATNNDAWYDEIRRNIAAGLADKPVLMLWGMKDRFVPGNILLPLWKSVWHNARFVELDNAGHFVEEEAPERVVAEIEQFLRENAISGALPLRT